MRYPIVHPTWIPRSAQLLWQIYTLVFQGKKYSEDPSTIFEHVLARRMLFDEEGNQPRLRSKSQTLCSGPQHKRIIWRKQVDMEHVLSQSYCPKEDHHAKNCLIHEFALDPPPMSSISSPVHKVWDFERRPDRFPSLANSILGVRTCSKMLLASSKHFFHFEKLAFK